MSFTAVYLMAGDQPDPAIERGLIEAGCAIQCTRSIPATIAALQAAHDSDGRPALLVAEVQAGGIALMALLQEQGVEPSAILVFDQSGSDIHTVVKALQYGASDYLLGRDADFQREIRARVLAERASMQSHKPARRREAAAPGSARSAGAGPLKAAGFQWDPATHIIMTGNGYLRLSPVEGRMFDLLLNRRNQIVPLEELIAAAFNRPGMDTSQGVKLLRPHMMRLRHKLERFPETSRRIVNLRGSGYMFI